MNIWLDDQRDAPKGWIHLHNLKEVEKFIESAMGISAFYIDKMSFDFHLSHPKRGIDVMKYLADLCKKEKATRFWPRSILYHSSDPIGVKIMKAFAETFDPSTPSVGSG